MPKRYRILKEYANGVMDEKGKFYPYKIVSGIYNGQGFPEAYAMGKRCYIKSVTFQWALSGAYAAGTDFHVGFYDQDLAPVTIEMHTPIMAAGDVQVGAVTIPVGVLCHQNSKADFYFSVPNTGEQQISMVWAEVDETEGEYVQ